MSNPMEPNSKGPIAWMARNGVAANLLMFILLMGGIFVGLNIKQEVFPEFELDIVSVRVDYPGASPDEVEEGLVIAIEDEVRSLDGVEKVTSLSFEGYGIVFVELIIGSNNYKILQDVKNVVDRIRSFPEEAETPIVNLIEPRRQVVSLLVYGDQERKTLWELSEKVRDDLIGIEGITLVEISGVPPLEISIEVPENVLRSYNLTLNGVADIVRQTALDLPAGGVKTTAGEILLRTQEKRDFAQDFSSIPIVSTADGSKVLLGDIATIREQFEATDQEAYFNGMPAVRINVFRTGDQGPIEISDLVNEYTVQLRKELPDGIGITPWDDSSDIFSDRMNLLLKNALFGLTLVLIFLALFLKPKLAFWVTLGIPVSIIGSFLFIPLVGASINMISLFAFIVTLGIIVDDAVLVGENVYHNREKGLSNLHASIVGARKISGPVSFAILTNIVAFIPLFFVPGPAGKFFKQIPSIVISVFAISYIESLYILPAHLSHHDSKSRFWKAIDKPSLFFEKWLHRFIDNIFIPQLRLTLTYRYLTMTLGISLLAIAGGAYFGGHITVGYFPKVESDVVTAQAILPYGIPIKKSRDVKDKLVVGMQDVIEDLGKGEQTRGVYIQIGAPITSFQTGNPALQLKGSHLVASQVYLMGVEQRSIDGIEMSKKWRDQVGAIPEIENISFSGSLDTSGDLPIDLQLSHPDRNKLEAAARKIASELEKYQGINDVDDGIALGKPQMSFKLKPEAQSLGITTRDLANQVRGAFYGAEALRQQRGRNEMKIMVRLPEEDREKINTVEELIIRTPKGGEIPLSEAAEIIHERAYTNIRRSNGRRFISVTADLDSNVANAAVIIEEMERNVLPKIQEEYPELTYTVEGDEKRSQKDMKTLFRGFALALFGIYALLAIPFRSYIQPLIVMLSIPFGVIGAVLGHILLGYDLTIISMFGIVALSGVVVNDSLVLIVTLNENVKRGAASVYDAAIEAARRRFRPIMLTSLTTFFGLSPMIFERSMQARFLIPMAISLGFGILFATFIIFLITTSLAVILDDVKRFFGKK